MSHRKSPHFFSTERPEDWRQEAKQLIYTHLYQFISANKSMYPDKLDTFQ